MGDCDFLFAMKSGKPQGASMKDYSVIMCAETDPDMRVPLLWGALFRYDDHQALRRSLDGKRHTLPAWHTSLAAACENLKQRKAQILNHVHPALHPFVDAFERAITACRYPYLQLDMNTLAAWLGHDREAVEARVRACLDAFESEEGWQAYFGGPQITDTVDLYGMSFFLGGDWSPVAGQLGWYEVGPDGKIHATGSPGGVFTMEDDAEEEESRLPLFFDACAKGELPVIRSLLASGQDVNERVVLPRASDVTGLMLASLYGRSEVVAELIRAGADADAQTDQGAFALALAAEDGHTEVVKMLLDAGADVKATNTDGWDALFMATINNHEEVRKLLLAQPKRDAPGSS